MKQTNLETISGKSYMLEHWNDYDVVDSKQEFLELLNILQAIGESLESLNDAYQNGYYEFSYIFHGEPWNSRREIVEALYQYCAFYTDSDFIDFMLEQRENYETDEEYTEAYKRITFDEDGDEQIYKTDDGYVRRVWY